MTKVDANTPGKTKAHRVAHDIRVMLYPHENIVDSRLYTSVTPPRTHGCIESLREIGSACFSDRSLCTDIFPLRSQQRGRCSYCESDNVPLVEPTALADYFELLVSSYEFDPQGKLLVQCFRGDWGLFEHPRMDDAHAKDLLADILNDGEIVRRTFKASFVTDGNQLGDWEELREERRYRDKVLSEG